MKTAMSEKMSQGHFIPTPSPKPGKGTFQQVGTFIDDIYFGRARSSTATFFDVNRIEVLKGPQSTFFGNNAILLSLIVALTSGER